MAEWPLLSGEGGWVPSHCYSVPYMKIPANNQVIFIKHSVAMAAYRSCRLWRRVKRSWCKCMLSNHDRTQCSHAIRYAAHISKTWLLEYPRWPPEHSWQDVRQWHKTVKWPGRSQSYDLMICDVSVIIPVSLDVGFPHNLPNPLADAGPHKVPDGCPMQKQPLSPPPCHFTWRTGHKIRSGFEEWGEP